MPPPHRRLRRTDDFLNCPKPREPGGWREGEALVFPLPEPAAVPRRPQPTAYLSGPSRWGRPQTQIHRGALGDPLATPILIHTEFLNAVPSLGGV